MKYRWDKKYKYWGVTAFLVLAAAIAFYFLMANIPVFARVIGKIFSAVSGILYGVAFAYLLAPVVNFLERTWLKGLPNKVFRKSPRKARAFTRIVAVAIAVTLGLLLVTGILILVLPQLLNSVGDLAGSMSDYLASAKQWTGTLFSSAPSVQESVNNAISGLGTSLTEWLETELPARIETVLSVLSDTVFKVVGVVVNVFVGVIACIYLLYHKEDFLSQAKRLVYGVFNRKWADRVLRACTYTHEKFGGFISGKILDSLIIGVLCFIGLLILRVPYAGMIATVVGVTNVIPFFGPFIGAIPSAFILLIISPVKCLIFCVFIFALQQVDGNIIGPKILGSATGISGFWVLFSILLGGGLFGFIGMVVAVPLFATIYAGITLLNERLLEKRKMPLSAEAYRQKGPVKPLSDNDE